MQGMWTDLGEYAPNSSNPFDQDPFMMNDLRDPSQPAGPFGGLGQAPSQPQTQQQQWADIGQQAASVVTQAGDIFVGAEAMKASAEMAKKASQQGAPQAGYGSFQLAPTAPRMSTQTIVFMVLAGAAVVGIGVWLVMRKKRR